MSDSSSEEEDLSRFREAVDNSFTKLIGNSNNSVSGHESKRKDNLKSERYLNEASHYNDVQVPEQMQHQIGAKVSALINKNIEFIDVDPKPNRKHKIKGGVKLFTSSPGYLTCEEIKDIYTEKHNAEAKKIIRKRRLIDAEEDHLNDNDKVNAAAVSGEQIMAKEDTKFWKSRRKENIFNYKKQGKSKMLTLVE